MHVNTLKISECVFLLVVLMEFADSVSYYRKNCPPLKLINGRSRYRLRGRNVRFNCIRGFQLVGAKYTSCMNGKWDANVPICVKYGCRAPSTTHVNGQFIESYRGAVVKIICNPGYGLVGSPSVYCNGVRWNETFPVCKVFNDRPDLYCDFEAEDLCGWSQDPMHDFDWRRKMALAPTGEIAGPPFDSTYKLNGSGHYIYMGSSKSRMENATARLYSPVYPSQISNGSCFKFSYYMHGDNAGTLKVFMKPEGVELYNLIPSFWMIGKQGNSWNQATFYLEPTKTPFQIVVEGISRPGYESEMAFDDAKIAFGDECVVLESSTTSTDFPTSVSTNQFGDEDDDISTLGCRNRCNQTKPSSSSPEEEWCDCQEQCIQTENCCSDYFDVCQFSVSTSVTTESERNILTSTVSSTSEAVTKSSFLNLGHTSRIPSQTPPNNFDLESNELISSIPASPSANIPPVNRSENEIPRLEWGIQKPSETQGNATEKVGPAVVSAILSAANKTASVVVSNEITAANKAISNAISEKESVKNKTAAPVAVSDKIAAASNKTISVATPARSPATGETVPVVISNKNHPANETVSDATSGKRPPINKTDPVAGSEKKSATEKDSTTEEKDFRKWKIPVFHPVNPNISEAVKQTGRKAEIEKNSTGSGFKPERKKSSDSLAGMPKPETEARKLYGRKNLTIETINRNSKRGNDSVESNGIFPLPSNSSSTSAKFLKNVRMPNAINPNLIEKVSVPVITNESRFQKEKPKEVLGKEPPQAIKIDRKEESRKETFGGVLESAGICSAIFVIAVILGFICYRRRKNRKSDRSGMVEDSDSIIYDTDSHSSTTSEYHSLVCIRSGTLGKPHT